MLIKSIFHDTIYLMKTLGGLMERFKHLQAPERSVRKALVEAVESVVGVEIDGEGIKIAGESAVYLSGLPSAVRTAIFEQKQAVLSRANNILGKEQLKELR